MVAELNYQELYAHLKNRFKSEIFTSWELNKELPECVDDCWAVIYVLRDLGMLEIVYVSPVFNTMTTFMRREELRML